MSTHIVALIGALGGLLVMDKLRETEETEIPLIGSASADTDDNDRRDRRPRPRRPEQRRRWWHFWRSPYSYPPVLMPQPAGSLVPFVTPLLSIPYIGTWIIVVVKNDCRNCQEMVSRVMRTPLPPHVQRGIMDVSRWVQHRKELPSNLAISTYPTVIVVSNGRVLGGIEGIASEFDIRSLAQRADAWSVGTY